MEKVIRLQAMTREERRERFDLLSEMGCAICEMPPQIHHLIGYKHRGLSQRAPDDKTIPLCLNHHTGQDGIHKMGMRPWEEKYGTQEYLLEVTNIKIKMLKDIHKNGYIDRDNYDIIEEQDAN
jgi:hypothetical protein